MNEQNFIGEWQQVRPNPAPASIFIEFEEGGRLKYTVETETVQHFLLTWRVEGDVLITDQPSAQRLEATRFRFVTPTRLVLELRDETYVYERC